MDYSDGREGGSSGGGYGGRGLRAHLVLGPGTGRALGAEGADVLRWGAEAAFGALSRALSVRGGALGGGLLELPARCDLWRSGGRGGRREVWECARWSVPESCSGQAPHDPGLFSTAAPARRSCPAGEGPSAPRCPDACLFENL